MLTNTVLEQISLLASNMAITTDRRVVDIVMIDQNQGRGGGQDRGKEDVDPDLVMGTEEDPDLGIEGDQDQEIEVPGGMGVKVEVAGIGTAIEIERIEMNRIEMWKSK